ncbi:phosphopantetheine-binding protein [Nocardiopsis sp. ARC36]
MYRTGDRGRRLPNGEFEFLGRVDRQVKVRGFRIEPEEIESVLSGHPSVGATAVVAAVDGRGEKRLAAYVAPSGHTEPTVAELREWIVGRLPEYMAPHNYLVLDQLPLDPNGKVDRRSLPEPWSSRSGLGLGQPYVAPETDIERLVALVLADVLGLDEVGRHDDFFEIGGDSLSSVRVLEDLRAKGVAMSAREFFGRPTPEALGLLVSKRPGAPGAPAEGKLVGRLG